MRSQHGRRAEHRCCQSFFIIVYYKTRKMKAFFTLLQDDKLEVWSRHLRRAERRQFFLPCFRKWLISKQFFTPLQVDRLGVRFQHGRRAEHRCFQPFFIIVYYKTCKMKAFFALLRDDTLGMSSRHRRRAERRCFFLPCLRKWLFSKQFFNPFARRRALCEVAAWHKIGTQTFLIIFYYHV